MTRTVYKFYADWCEPCRSFAPVVAGVIASHPELQFREINVDLDPQTAFQYRVMSLPALLFIENERVVGRIDGACTDNMLRETLALAFPPEKGDAP